MHRIYSLCILVLVLVGSVNSSLHYRQRRQANGCGPGYFNIDASLRLVGEGSLKSCCNAHDICYDTCGRSQDSCDNAFRSCLDSTCSRLSGGFQWWGNFRVAACKLDGRVLYEIVSATGSVAYSSAQKAHGCIKG
ncbi:hypothetical protein I4U23_016295 [Adineta vaga]|nr:hypothetical protein I4U23_016295 [Adineta vaga]